MRFVMHFCNDELSFPLASLSCVCVIILLVFFLSQAGLVMFFDGESQEDRALHFVEEFRNSQVKGKPE